jgi:hypothetical protein
MSLVIFHTQHSINCANIIRQFAKGEKYLSHKNLYLLPYHCKDVNHQQRLIVGGFINPLWNSLERTILTKSNNFDYTYIRGHNFLFEYDSDSKKKYHIFGDKHVYANAIQLDDNFLGSSSILLFPIQKDIAEPLISHKLL